MNKFLLTLTFIIINLGLAQAEIDIESCPEYTEYGIGVEAGYQYLTGPHSEDITVLDIRSSKKFYISHLKNSINIDFYDNGFNYEMYQMDRNGLYFIYSDDDNNAYNTVLMMLEMEFISAYFLKGGFRAWRKAGLPVYKYKKQ